LNLEIIFLKRYEAKSLFAACLFLSIMLSSRGGAQTFEEGYQSYMRNQFPVAELQFRSAVKQAKTKEDRAFILKFMGICQFMRGDKKSAVNTFHEALAADRNITIDEEEVLDPGVVSFFNVIKTRWISSPESQAAAKGPAQKNMAVAAKSPAAPVAPVAAKTLAQEQLPAAKVGVQEPKPASPANAIPTDPKTKKKKTKEALSSSNKPEAGSRIFSWMYLMPFGLGQFHNESYFLGSAVAIGQVYSLYQYQFLSSQISKERKQNQEVEVNPNVLQSRKDEFLLENANYISGLKKDRDTAGTLFAALWIGGVIEACISAPRYRASDAGSSPESSRKIPSKSIGTAWLPNSLGGTYLVQVKYSLQ
jgi:hypothetical protein